MNEDIPAPLLAAIILEIAAANGHGQLARIIGAGTIHADVSENRVQTQNLETGIALLQIWSEIGHALKQDPRKTHDTHTKKIAVLQELTTVMEQKHDDDLKVGVPGRIEVLRSHTAAEAKIHRKLPPETFQPSEYKATAIA